MIDVDKTGKMYKTLLFITLVCTSCVLGSSPWSQKSSEPYSYIGLIDTKNYLLGADIFGTDIWFIDVNSSNPINSVQPKIQMPPGILVGKMCAGNDISVMAAGDAQEPPVKFLRYDPTKGKWEDIPSTSLGEPISCKVLNGGEILLRGDRGALLLSNGVVDEIRFQNEETRVLDAALDENGSLWILGTDGNIYERINGALKLFGRQSGHGIVILDDIFWILDRNTLYFQPINDNMDNPTKAAELPPSSVIINVFQGNQHVWVVATTGVWKNSGTGFDQVASPWGVKKITSAAFKNNTLYMATNKGVFSIVE